MSTERRLASWKTIGTILIIAISHCLCENNALLTTIQLFLEGGEGLLLGLPRKRINKAQTILGMADESPYETVSRRPFCLSFLFSRNTTNEVRKHSSVGCHDRNRWLR